MAMTRQPPVMSGMGQTIVIFIELQESRRLVPKTRSGRIPRRSADGQAPGGKTERLPQTESARQQSDVGLQIAKTAEVAFDLDRSKTVGQGTGTGRCAVVGHHAIDANAERCVVGNKVVRGFSSTSL